MSLSLKRSESVMRVYVGLLWFYPHPPTSLLADAVQQVQSGVDKVVAATPVLGGVLREGAPVRVEYDANSKVPATGIEVPYTYADMEKDGFNQEKYSQLFDCIPNITPEVEGLAVFKVWVFGLACGGVAVATAIHHSLGDAMAVTEVAMSIGRACADSEYKPTAMWSCRDRQYEMLKASLRGDEIVDDSYTEHLHQLMRTTAGTGALETQGPVGSHQFSLKAESLRRLKELAILGSKDGGEVCSTNDMVVALFWRAHARALASHGSTSEFTYTGGPKDLRGAVGATNYLGNMIVLCPLFAAKSFVLDHGLVPVARLIRRYTQDGSAASLLRFIEEMENGAPDILTTLAARDSPSTAFSNMTRLPLRRVDFGMGELGTAQLRSFCVPYIIHAIDDGASGFLANICLPTSMMASFTSDEEFMSYVDKVY
ncbi:hypothetical protein IWW39_001665 [Coemansia spiralis]|uniref:Uncharacterized protein n=2 Tax=Coemansia TaxID=4863 RepID=A0A9W8GLJ9_9FUNG|nr:hypothetical protein IWW39_001665 [Coemansia spiralis]